MVRFTKKTLVKIIKNLAVNLNYQHQYIIVLFDIILQSRLLGETLRRV